MRCPYCDQEHPDEARFCPATGEQLEQFEQAKATCPNCSKASPSDARFCTTCGTILSSPIEQKIKEAQPDSEEPSIDEQEKEPKVVITGEQAVVEENSQSEEEITAAENLDIPVEEIIGVEVEEPHVEDDQLHVEAQEHVPTVAFLQESISGELGEQLEVEQPGDGDQPEPGKLLDEDGTLMSDAHDMQEAIPTGLFSQDVPEPIFPGVMEVDIPDQTYEDPLDLHDGTMPDEGQTAILCSKCGATLKEMTKFCTVCGHSMQPDSEGKTKTLKIIAFAFPIIGVISLIVLCIGAFFIIRQIRKNTGVSADNDSFPIAIANPFATPTPTSTSTPIPTRTPSITRTPTVTPTLTVTQTSSKTPTSTRTPRPTFTPTSKWEAGVTQVSDVDRMVGFFVPAGDFLMGSTDKDQNAKPDEKPQRKVYVDAFWIDRTEVTSGMFEKFVNETGYETDAEKRGYGLAVDAQGQWLEIESAYWQYPQGKFGRQAAPNYPVVHVSWHDAQAYCEWVGGRLPTEAEWEKAARGTEGQIFPWGEHGLEDFLLNFADRNLNVEYRNKQINDGYRLISPVGRYPTGASPYGALDMAGNVWEWVSDWYSPTYYRDPSSTVNPAGPSSGDLRVLRGGSWNNKVEDVRTVNRGKYDPSGSTDYDGFRCVRPDNPEKPAD